MFYFGVSMSLEIVDWDKHFEKADSRKRLSLYWVAMPNKHDGLGFRRIMRHPQGMTIFGAWCLLVQIASKCPKRGLLQSADGVALSADDMALKTGASADGFLTAFPVLLEVGWIKGTYNKSADTSADDASESAVNADRRPPHNSTEQDSTEQTKDISSEPLQAHEPEAVIMSFPVTGKARQWDLKETLYRQFCESYETLNVMAEMKKALAWTIANPTKKKTERGMGKFLVGWLNRAVDSGRYGNGNSNRQGAQIDPARVRSPGRYAGREGERFE